MSPETDIYDPQSHAIIRWNMTANELVSPIVIQGGLLHDVRGSSASQESVLTHLTNQA